MGYGRRRTRVRGPSATQPNQPDPQASNLAFPRGPVGGFAQAADFYDSVGINHHPEYLPDADLDTAVARVQELGLRHIRLGCYSPANHGASNFQRRSGTFGTKIATANANRAVGVHPILVDWGTTEEPAYEASRGSAIYTITDGDGTFLRPLDGPSGSVSRDPPSGTPLIENAGTYYDQGWITAGALQGPNEPDNSRATYWGESGGNMGVRETFGALKSAKNARTSEIVMAGADYIDSTTGRITQGPAYAPQIPMIAAHLVGNNWANLGSAATVVPLIDGGCRHTYWGGHGPNYTELEGQWTSSTSYTGAPKFCTETGYRQRVSWASTGENVLGAERYTPPDASGEYIIRTLIQNYLQGVRRTYLYKLNDESSTNSAPWIYGIHDVGWTRRASFHAIKNLMTLVGWNHAPTSAALTANVTGFTVGSSYTIGGGDGYVMPDRLDKLVLQRSVTEYLVLLTRQRELWDRGLQQDITVSDPQTITVTFGQNIATAAVAEPAKNSIESPSDGGTYANPTDGTAYDPLTISGGNSVSLAIRGLTRVIKVTTS